MNTKGIITAGITGTTFMTAFSYLVSEMKNRNFKEPNLLQKMIFRIMPWQDKQTATAGGWLVHYFAGLLFATVYERLWEKTRLEPTFRNSLAFGAISGLLAIAVWKATLTFHPNPPKTNFRRYAGHLFVTHLVFAVFATLGYRFMRARKNRRLQRS